MSQVSARKVIEFTLFPRETRSETPWEWMQGIFDKEFPIPRWKRILIGWLYLIIKKGVSSSNQSKAQIFYRYLPRSIRELQSLRKSVLDCLKWSQSSHLSTRLLLAPYCREFQAMLLAINTKIANQFTNPNLNGWDDRACNLFLEIQSNLSEIRPLYFATITFRDVLNFETVSSHLTDLRDNTLSRAGFQSVGVIAYHAMTPDDLRRNSYRRDPSRPRERRLHVHLLFWPQEGVSRDQIARMLRRLQHALDCGRHGIGYYRFSKIKGMLDFLKRAAYMAFNYSVSLKYNRGEEWNPIPTGARLLRLPRNDRHHTRWPRIIDDRISTSQRAWEKAVIKYADKMAYDYRGYWIKQFAERIQELVEPEEWQDPKVSGVDGFEYLISPVPPALGGEQQYELINPERPRWMISEEELQELGKLEVYPGALPWNPDMNPIDGTRITIPRKPRQDKRTALALAISFALGVMTGYCLRNRFRV